MTADDVVSNAKALARKVGTVNARQALLLQGYRCDWLDRYLPLPAACWRNEDFGLDDAIPFWGVKS